MNRGDQRHPRGHRPLHRLEIPLGELVADDDLWRERSQSHLQAGFLRISPQDIRTGPQVKSPQLSPLIDNGDAAAGGKPPQGEGTGYIPQEGGLSTGRRASHQDPLLHRDTSCKEPVRTAPSSAGDAEDQRSDIPQTAHHASLHNSRAADPPPATHPPAHLALAELLLVGIHGIAADL